MQVATGDLRQRHRELPLATLTLAATAAIRQLLSVFHLVKRVYVDHQQQQRLEPALQSALIVAANNLARFAYCLSKVSMTASSHPPAAGNATLHCGWDGKNFNWLARLAVNTLLVAVLAGAKCRV